MVKTISVRTVSSKFIGNTQNTTIVYEVVTKHNGDDTTRLFCADEKDDLERQVMNVIKETTSADYQRHAEYLVKLIKEEEEHENAVRKRQQELHVLNMRFDKAQMTTISNTHNFNRQKITVENQRSAIEILGQENRKHKKRIQELESGNVLVPEKTCQQ